MTAPSDARDEDAGGVIPRPLSDASEAARDKAARAVDAAKDGLAQAKETLSGALAGGRDKASDAYATSRDTAADVYASGRDKAADLYASGRDRASEAYVAARERAKAAGETVTERLDTSPLLAVIGGLAAGLVVGALLPRTERETEALGGLGVKLNGLAKEALEAARDAGQAKLAELGLTPDKAREQLHTLIDGAVAAATSAGTAAVDTARSKAPEAPAETNDA